MFPGLRSPLPDAVIKLAGVDRHGRVVAIKGELRSSGLRFDPSLSCGRAQWTRVAHEDTRLARVAHREIGRSRTDLRAREASKPSEAVGRGMRATMLVALRPELPVFVIFVSSP